MLEAGQDISASTESLQVSVTRRLGPFSQSYELERLQGRRPAGGGAAAAAVTVARGTAATPSRASSEAQWQSLSLSRGTQSRRGDSAAGLA
jgi:hypothetical protein